MDGVPIMEPRTMRAAPAYPPFPTPEHPALFGVPAAANSINRRFES